MGKGRVIAAVAAIAISGFVAPAGAAEARWPASVSTVYRLYFNGFEVGSFAFKSHSKGKNYQATSNAKVSALFGAFKWKGTISARGALAAKGPQPASYTMNFTTKSKEGSIRLGFDKGGVKSVAVEPKKPPHPEAVPVKSDQLKSVFDPVSAILAMTHWGDGKPCDKTIPIFDGKARFDLRMSYKGREPLQEARQAGQPSELVVCRIKYTPVAGHKPKDFVDPWVDYDGIEIALRPVPSANVYIPYRITVPTSLGAAVMSAQSAEIAAEGKPVIALKTETP